MGLAYSKSTSGLSLTAKLVIPSYKQHQITPKIYKYIIPLNISPSNSKNRNKATCCNTDFKQIGCSKSSKSYKHPTWYGPTKKTRKTKQTQCLIRRLQVNEIWKNKSNRDNTESGRIHLWPDGQVSGDLTFSRVHSHHEDTDNLHLPTT